MFSRLLYRLAVHFYILGIHITAFFSPKARQWINGRRGLFNKLQHKIKDLPTASSTLWMHCASLGEFEQGRPVLELLKKRNPQIRVILSFFSPSGFEVRKDYEGADIVCYLPADTPKNARQFIEILQPDLAIFVKYEFWYYHLKELKEKEIPALLISALFRPNQIFFKPYGKLFRQMLHTFQHIFVQNQTSGKLLEQINLKNYSFGGDSRVDRVADIAKAPKDFSIIAQFVGNAKVIVAGSTWSPDEKILTAFINRDLPSDWKIIMAPHQINKSAIQQLGKNIQLPWTLYSAAEAKSLNDYRVLIIDNVGMLAHLYQYGTLAYIGGGFGVGIHNTLEPIAFGLPLFFGPKYHKFEEANYLVEKGSAVVVWSEKELREGFIQWLDPARYEHSANQALQYIQTNQGASGKIVNYISQLC